MSVREGGICFGQHVLEVVSVGGLDLLFPAHHESKQFTLPLTAVIGRHAEHHGRTPPAPE